jgi:hypothetical protein
LEREVDTTDSDPSELNIWELLGDIRLVPNGLGYLPIERGPWGSRWITDSSNQGIYRDGIALQFFIDADGFPVVTDQGRLIHFNETRDRFVVVF